ncbi:hypothetical protein [Emergencia sp.]|uniref:hypothetical protein n=1 Tax=Emergencia sp. TaxID=1926557 RepID=UPI003AF0AE4A
MAHIIILNEDERLVAIGTLKTYWSNGYPVITKKDGQVCAYPTDVFTIYEVETLQPEIETEKYCYNPKAGFYIHPEWVEPNNPYGIPNEEYDKIEQHIVDSITKGVSTNE